MIQTRGEWFQNLSDARTRIAKGQTLWRADIERLVGLAEGELHVLYDSGLIDGRQGLVYHDDDADDYDTLVLCWENDT